MQADESTKTRPTLLKRARDLTDHQAWLEFFTVYDRYVRLWCLDYRLERDFAEEVCQEFWLELSAQMGTFCYDPSRRFRGWLRQRFHWRVLDALRIRGREEPVFALPDPSAVIDPGEMLSGNEQTDGEIDDKRLVLMKLAQEVQAAVRDNVTAQSWQVFWHVSVDGWTKKETAKALGMKTLAVHAANKRVAERLAKEGARRLGEMN